METINFVLRTTDINPDNNVTSYYNLTYSNNLGTIAQNRSSITWNNVNLKAILGEMYDRYEKFNISLNFIAGAAVGSSIDAIVDNRIFYVRLKGLNFITSYNQLTQNNCGSVVLTSIQVPLTINTSWLNNYFTQQYFTFQKNDMVQLNIDLLNIYDDLYYQPSSNARMLGHMIFSFNIYGCEDYKNVQSNSNQNIDLELRKIF